ncbi:hypothetical protein [Cryobacterium lyxosi]|uniref:hypothetical protein n=1 Tax=Cryobacterium lyxosi TaxID=1259228 RepID=UPI00141B7C81|nr:hypothetical protein [Cryobacterium lyxosi]
MKALRWRPAVPRYEAVSPGGNDYGNGNGNGYDFSGVVDELGDAVAGFPIGDAVSGGKRMHAQVNVVVDATRIPTEPAAITDGQAGGLDSAVRAAWASVAAPA